MNEKLLEKKLREEVKKMGGLALKFSSSTYTGMPDRIVLMPFNQKYWVEIKSTGETLTPKQEAARKKLKRLGQDYAFIDDQYALDLFLKQLKDVHDIRTAIELHLNYIPAK